MDILIELHYFPCISYFRRLLSCETVFLEAAENYQKQTYRNRCYILGANKIQLLSVPVKKAEGKTSVRDVKIDYSMSWQSIHYRSIVSAYGKSPFFEYYIDYFREVFEKKTEFLFDLNYQILNICAQLMQFELQVKLTSEYNSVNGAGVKEIADLRNTIIPENRNAPNAANLRYQQMFGKEFVHDLSIIDLLFCEGPQAFNYLRHK
ncbi:MAG: WbqC family protein [Cytophagaceae bacterium]